PPGPSVLLAHWGRRLQQFPARAQSGSDRRAQLAAELGNRVFDVDLSAVDLLGAKQVRKFLERVIANHGPGAPQPELCQQLKILILRRLLMTLVLLISAPIRLTPMNAMIRAESHRHAMTSNGWARSSQIRPNPLK